MSNAIATIESAGGTIDHAAILKSLNLNPRDPNTQALLLVCERYGLDPLLKHMVLISGNPYITRDGYLAIAHRSGEFDGMEVVEQGETQTHFTAKVAVYRKDMGRPFTFIGRYPKTERMAQKYGPEMAVKVAEVQALRRAFNVTGVGAADEQWDEHEPATPQQQQHVAHTRPPSSAVVVGTRELPEAPPAAQQTKNPHAQAIHILASQVAKAAELNADMLADLAVSHATGGASTSANDLNRTTRDLAKSLLEDIRDGKVFPTISIGDDGSESYALPEQAA